MPTVSYSREASKDEMATEIDRRGAVIERLEAERDALLARIEELEGALEPFSDVAGEGTEDYPDDQRVVMTSGRTTFYALTLGHFRRASAVLSEGKG